MLSENAPLQPISLLIIVAGIVFIIVYFRYLKNSRLRSVQIQQGTQWLICFKSILANFQKHRGLSTGFINGDTGLDASINAIQQDIAKATINMATIGEWSNHNAQWQGVYDHWQRLSKNYKNLDPEHNFKQHNNLIKSFLYLIEDMADEFGMARLKHKLNYNPEILWGDLLVAIEYLGQARAAGTGVAAKGECDSVEKIRLNYLRTKIEKYLEKLKFLTRQGSSATQAIDAMFLCIDNNILRSPCSISPEEYFYTATQALDALYELFDTEVSKLKA